MSNPVLPAGSVVRLEVLFALPVAATQEQILEWVTFEVGNHGSLNLKNPLSHHGLEAFSEPILADTGKRQREEHKPIGEGRISVRRWLEDRL